MPKLPPNRPTDRGTMRRRLACAWTIGAIGLSGGAGVSASAEGASAMLDADIEPPSAVGSPTGRAPADSFTAAEPGEPRTALETIEVTATRSARSTFEVPASISVVEGADYRTDSLGANLSEKLLAVPGVLARDRQNYAQDLQLSIRGFGARSTFGIRGVRLYIDGIPATLPDGQGQVSNFNLASADRVEVLRGPFSALYGNAAGGVIALFSAAGQEPDELAAGASAGSYDALRTSVGARGRAGAMAYNVDLTRLTTDGYRDHSGTERRSGNAKLDYALGESSRVSLLLNGFFAPNTRDPLGLNASQFLADPRQAPPPAMDFDTRKSVDQQQAGLVLEHATNGDDELRLLGYYGERRVEQFLAVPVATQSNPLSGGGVVALRTPFSGTDARWTCRATLGGTPLELVVGLTYDNQDQHRRGYENFIDGTLGVRGALRRDEIDRTWSADQYAQASWEPGPAWTVLGGVRHSRVSFDSRDRFVSARNPDDSGRTTFETTSPVAGLMYRANDAMHLYASYGRGFETPTFDEIGYRPDGSAGINLALRAARTRSGEFGVKWRPAPTLRVDAAWFRSETRDELAIATNAGGRATFQNVDRARRAGVEVAASAALGGRWTGRFAYTYLDARFRDAFLTCAATPCSRPNVEVPAKTRIPGVPRSAGYASVRWGAEPGWHAQVEGQYLGSVPVNHLGSQSAKPYAVFGLSLGHGWRWERGSLRTFVAVGNIFDRRYAGSVIVNESSGRYFEPAPGRNFLLGFELRGRP